MTNLVDELINLLDLESIELNLFRGVSSRCPHISCQKYCWYTRGPNATSTRAIPITVSGST